MIRGLLRGRMEEWMEQIEAVVYDYGLTQNFDNVTVC
jgi:hypothetical protein